MDDFGRGVMSDSKLLFDGDDKLCLGGLQGPGASVLLSKV